MGSDAATLGFAGGPAIVFRINPDSIDWSWRILTNVVETIGGRVVQVLGAWLDDLTVEGSFGQDHSTPLGESWRQAEAFLQLITSIMEYQSRDSTQQDLMHPPAIFTFPLKGWRFQCYVKDFSDADSGGSVVLTPGKFNNRYRLTLFIVQDASESLVQAGTTNGVFGQKAEDAIAAYFARIADGVGWHFSQYNGPVGTINKRWAEQFGASQQPAPVVVAPVPAAGNTQNGSSGPSPGPSGIQWWIVQVNSSSNSVRIEQLTTAQVAANQLVILGPYATKAAAASDASKHGYQVVT